MAEGTSGDGLQDTTLQRRSKTWTEPGDAEISRYGCVRGFWWRRVLDMNAAMLQTSRARQLVLYVVMEPHCPNIQQASAVCI